MTSILKVNPPKRRPNNSNQNKSHQRVPGIYIYSIIITTTITSAIHIANGHSISSKVRYSGTLTLFLGVWLGIFGASGRRGSNPSLPKSSSHTLGLEV